MSEPDRETGGRRAASFADALPGIAALLLLLLLGLREAGFQPTLWYPAGLFLLALLSIVLLTGAAVRPSRGATAAMAALGSFTVWCFASIAWSDVRGDALAGANRTLVYFTAFVLFALMPVPRGFVVALLGVYSSGIALIGLGTVARTTAHDDPASFFIDGRLAAPAGYPNAAAALLLGAYWPALTLSGRRQLPPLLRGALAAAATAVLGTAVLCQSRGSAIAFVAICVVQLAIVPDRARSLAALAVTGGAVAAAAPVLLDVYPALVDGSASGPVRSALLVLLAATAGAGGVAWLLAELDRRVVAPPETARRVSHVVIGATVLAILLGGGWAAARVSPAERLSAAWDDFTAGQDPPAGSSHLSSGLGSNRYDFWRVALGRFADRPLTGVGIENFAVDYVRERRSDEEPLHPHSLQVRILSQTGVPGAALFVLFLGAAGVASFRARGRDGLERASIFAALVAFAYWFAHSSVDWLWPFTGLTIPAVAWLGLATNGSVSGRDCERIGRPRALVVAAGTAAIGAAVLLALPWVAVREVRSAESGWVSDPDAADANLARARKLNPLSADADVVAGVIAGRRGDLPGMRAAYGRALERNPSSWFAELGLAVAESEAGRLAAALEHVRRSRRLNPREQVLRDAESSLKQGRPLDPADIERRFSERLESLTR
jgi:hypothetical protein